MKALFLVPGNEQNQRVIRDVLYGAWCSGKLIGDATAPPLSLLSCATVARDAGVDIEFLDAPGEGLGLEETLSRAEGCDAAVVLTSFMTFGDDLLVLRALKDRRPALRTVLFGAQATFVPDASLEDEVVTVAVLREPEYAIRDLLLAWRDGSEWHQLDGIAFRKEGGIQRNEPYPFIRNLDEMPLPDRSLLPQGVEYPNPLIEAYPYTTMLTSRGCPSRCTYCTAPYFFGGKLRVRSADSVLEEIRMVGGLGYRTVYFRDETLCAFRKRNTEICENLIAEGIRIKWLGNSIPGELNPEYLSLMKEAGLYLLKFGVESANNDLLQRVNKRTNLEVMTADFGLCRQMGIRTHAHCMLGMPGETRETIENTFRYIERDIRPTTVTYSVCSPYPGTPLFDEVSQQHPEVAEFSSHDLQIQNLHVQSRYNSSFTELTNDEIEAAVQEGYRRFYTRPSYLLKSFGRVRSLGHLAGMVRAGLKVVGFGVSGRK